MIGQVKCFNGYFNIKQMIKLTKSQLNQLKTDILASWIGETPDTSYLSAFLNLKAHGYVSIYCIAFSK